MKSNYSSSPIALSAPFRATRYTTKRFALVHPSVFALLIFTLLELRIQAVPAEPATEGYDTAPIEWAAYRKLWVPGIPTARADEGIRRTYDPALARRFLDDAAVKWVRHNRCATCHTSVPYLLATPANLTSHVNAVAEVRESVLSYAQESFRKPDVLTAFHTPPEAIALAINDARSGRSPDPRVRELFENVWRIQDPDGSWHYPVEMGFLPFLERDFSFVDILMALAAGYSADEVLATPEARAGFERMLNYIQAHKPYSMHHQAFLLWASVRTAGLLTETEQSETQRVLLSLQKSDGGWTLPSLGHWVRHDGAPNDPDGDSDGYATALAALVLCERGQHSSRPVRRALDWLESHQRVSGRWFTRSLYSDGFRNYLSNMASGYAVMAIEVCRDGDSLPRSRSAARSK